MRVPTGDENRWLFSPARASLLTGLYGHETGVDDNVLVWHSRVVRLPENQPTLIEWAKDAGYRVAYFGKWHLSPEGPSARGANPAFPLREGGRLRLLKPPGFERIKRYYHISEPPAEKPEYYGRREGTFEDTADYRYAAAAAKFLNDVARRRENFLLFVSFHAPHPPYVVPSPYDSLYSPDDVLLPPSFLRRSPGKPRYQNDVHWYWHDVGHLTEEDWRRIRAHCLGYMTMIDRAVDMILRAIDIPELKENTMVILVSDQGSILGEHGLYDKGPYCYDELMRIPLVIRAPGEEPRSADDLVSLVDVTETIVDWLGLEPGGAGRHGRSLLPLVRGRAGESGRRHATFYRYEWYNGDWWGIRAVRTLRWKYCWNPMGVDELYDLERDPYELRNRVDDPEAAGVLLNLRQLLGDHLEEVADPALSRFREMFRNREAR